MKVVTVNELNFFCIGFYKPGDYLSLLIFHIFKIERRYVTNRVEAMAGLGS